MTSLKPAFWTCGGKLLQRQSVFYLVVGTGSILSKSSFANQKRQPSPVRPEFFIYGQSRKNYFGVMAISFNTAAILPLLVA